MQDTLDHLINFAQLKGSINIQCQFQGAWLVEHEAHSHRSMVHIVTHGSGYIRIGTQPPRLLEKGDIIFFPQSQAHTLSHQATVQNKKYIPVTSQRGAFIHKSTGQGKADLKLFCATFEYDTQAELILNLPQVLFLHIEQSEIQPLLQLLKTESQLNGVASHTIINALAKVLFVKLIRCYLNTKNTVLSGTLNGWQDRRLRPLIQQVINAPEKNWGIEKMLEISPISRAQLIRLFKQKVGITPHAFVNKIRLQKAAMLLNQQSDSILTIALSTGFQSETHFGKAFKKQYGIPPSHYRRKIKACNP